MLYGGVGLIGATGHHLYESSGERRGGIVRMITLSRNGPSERVREGIDAYVVVRQPFALDDAKKLVGERMGQFRFFRETLLAYRRQGEPWPSSRSPFVIAPP